MADVDDQTLVSRVQDALANLQQAAEGAKRSGLEALVSLGAEAQERLDEMEPAGDLPEGDDPTATQLPS